jgi:hypothetical protein
MILVKYTAPLFEKAPGLVILFFIVKGKWSYKRITYFEMAQSQFITTLVQTCRTVECKYVQKWQTKLAGYVKWVSGMLLQSYG